MNTDKKANFLAEKNRNLNFEHTVINMRKLNSVKGPENRDIHKLMLDNMKYGKPEKKEYFKCAPRATAQECAIWDENKKLNKKQEIKSTATRSVEELDKILRQIEKRSKQLF
jgi:hypothetical protein